LALNKSGQKIFDKAFYLYQKIDRFIKSIYLNEHNNVEAIQEKFSPINETLALMDLYIQGLLLKISLADGNISEEEMLFITQLPQNINMLCEIMPNYKRIVKSLKTNSFANYKDDFLKESNKVPMFLYLSVYVDKERDTNESMYIIKNIEKICNCLMEINNNNKEKKIAITSYEILKMTSFVKDNGVFKEIEDEEVIKDLRVEKESDTQLKGNGTLDELLVELNELIGLSNVKNDVIEMINLIKYNNLRKEKGLKSIPISNHMVFTGSPGTGKTTIARLLAKIYKKLGVVSKGHFVETDRAGLVAGYVGQTALKVKDVVKKSIGGVLFIDEAYDLVREAGGNDFGEEAITTLVKMMEDNRDDLIVIVAGYTDKMDKFVKANPGLSSRFNKYIHFPDYRADELLDIFQYTCRKSDVLISESALSLASSIFKQQVNIDFGNARGIRNYFEKAISNQANRIVNITDVSKLELQTIEKEDLLLIELL
jgi:stage V sporulation protein K